MHAEQGAVNLCMLPVSTGQEAEGTLNFSMDLACGERWKAFLVFQWVYFSLRAVIIVCNNTP